MTSVAQIGQAIEELVGTTAYTGFGNGALHRTLPRRHPFLPWYVAGISSFRGVSGSRYTPVTNPGNILTPEMSEWCLYREYNIVIDFQPRPYAVFDDSNLFTYTETYYPESPGTVPVTFGAWNEWDRFTTLEILPSSDAVTLQLGAMCFNASGIVEDSKPFLAMPRMFLNNEMLKFTWYQVPLRYYTSAYSYLREYRGRVNATAWNTVAFGTFGPGELLYLGCTIKQYTPPLGTNSVVVSGASSESPGTLGFAKYCNFELVFSRTKRTRGAAPLHAPTNLNTVPYGHNLNPYFGSGDDPLSNTFLYTSTSRTGSTSSQPLFKSGPIPHILFRDPDTSDNILLPPTPPPDLP